MVKGRDAAVVLCLLQQTLISLRCLAVTHDGHGIQDGSVIKVWTVTRSEAGRWRRRRCWQRGALRFLGGPPRLTNISLTWWRWHQRCPEPSESWWLPWSCAEFNKEELSGVTAAQDSKPQAPFLYNDKASVSSSTSSPRQPPRLIPGALKLMCSLERHGAESSWTWNTDRRGDILVFALLEEVIVFFLSFSVKSSCGCKRSRKMKIPKSAPAWASPATENIPPPHLQFMPIIH